MSLLAGRKVLCSLDRGREIRPPSSIAGFEMFKRQETFAFIAGKMYICKGKIVL